MLKWTLPESDYYSNLSNSLMLLSTKKNNWTLCLVRKNDDRFKLSIFPWFLKIRIEVRLENFVFDRLYEVFVSANDLLWLIERFNGFFINKTWIKIWQFWQNSIK